MLTICYFHNSPTNTVVCITIAMLAQILMLAKLKRYVSYLFVRNDFRSTSECNVCFPALSVCGNFLKCIITSSGGNRNSDTIVTPFWKYRCFSHSASVTCFNVSCVDDRTSSLTLNCFKSQETIEVKSFTTMTDVCIPSELNDHGCQKATTTTSYILL